MFPYHIYTLATLFSPNDQQNSLEGEPIDTTMNSTTVDGQIPEPVDANKIPLIHYTLVN